MATRENTKDSRDTPGKRKQQQMIVRIMQPWKEIGEDTTPQENAKVHSLLAPGDHDPEPLPPMF